MNIELFEGQSCLVHVKLPEEWKVYGGTPKVEFRSERESADSVLVTVPAMEAEFTPLVPYELFARRTLDGKEWLVLSGQLHVRRRYSDAGGGISAIEYFVEPKLVEDGISSSPQIIVGIPGPQGPKGDKGDPGEGGMTEAEHSTLAGAAQRGGDNTFSAANTFTGSVDMSTAQVTPPEGWNVGDLTPEAIQAVVPIDWGEWTTAPKTTGIESLAIGSNAKALQWAQAIGLNANADGGYALAVGTNSIAKEYSNAIGSSAVCKNNRSICIGHAFPETIDGVYAWNQCRVQGTGSITIGAGANTLNYTAKNGTVAESSNAITIGCKAKNKGNDSVVIGASATSQADDYSKNSGSVVIGAGATHQGEYDVVIGKNARNTSIHTVCIGAESVAGYESVSIGHGSNAYGNESVSCGKSAQSNLLSVAVGRSSKALSRYCVAIGGGAQVSDYGATVIRSTAEDGTYTQLYFSGANTPLANTYEGGEAMMGYVVMQKGADGQFAPVAAGTQKLSVLFPNNSGFQPMALSLDDDMTPPTVFHPSDLDMPVEEPSEVEEYTPLPVYPIVEPDDIMGDNGTLEQGGTENTSPETNS